MGLVCAAIYILLLMLFIPFAFSSSIMHRANGTAPQEGINVVDFPHHQARYILNQFDLTYQAN
jgi:UDP-N-acetylglucosamine--dolichyl-phosphate N-acetylglucosaminephosphotransferase